MDNKELLNNFIDNVIKNDAQMETTFKQFTINKFKDILNSQKKSNKLVEAFQALKKQLNENYDIDLDIKHDGTVTVSGKPVGKVVSDMQDFEGGINFVTIDGRASKEFDTIEQLTSYVAQMYGRKSKM